jgi:hypothetical protein
MNFGPQAIMGAFGRTSAGSSMLVAGVVAAALASCGSDNSTSASALRCAGPCELTYTRITIDGRDTPEFMFDANSAVARDRQGRVIVLAGSSYLPEVFDSVGKYVKPLARRGNGPGELPRAFAVEAGADDSIRVFSWPDVSVFGPNLVFVRSFVLRDGPPPVQVELLKGGRLLVKTRRLEGRNQVMLTRVFEADGSLIRAMDLSDPARQLRGPRIGVAKDRSEFWGARTLAEGGAGYELSLFSQGGAIVRTIERRPEWWLLSQAPNNRAQLGSIPMDVHEDDHGHLIVIVAQPKPNWRDIDPTGNHTAKLFDTNIEVLAASDGSLVGKLRVAGWPMAILDGRHVATFYEVDDYPMLDLIRFVFDD